MAAASSASTFASNSGSSAATSTAATTATGPSSGSSHRDFRPVSFLTQQPHSTLTDYSSKVELQEPTKGGNRKPAENPYIPSPHNNILPPSQLNILRSQSPDLNKRDTPNGRVMGSPSLKPSMPKDEAGASKVSQSPRMVPSNPGRPASPSSLRLAHGGGFPLFEASQWFREPKNPNRQRRSDEDDRSETRSISEPSYLRPQLHPSKESSSSTATTTTTATSISTLQSPPASGGSATTVETPTTTTNATGLTAIKPRVPFDNFYSLADPYKELNQNEPTDFFTAVTQSDNTTIERMLKAFPALIHDSHGFWPHPTPIHVAARSRHPLETMKILIKHGAALDRGDHNGTTVLHFVCEQYPDPLEAVVFLTKAGTDCNARDAKKRTPLMVLLQNTHIVSTRVMVDSMRVMFKFGASAKVADHQFQRSPLHYAILHCKEPAPVIELLLKKGADVNARDHRKSTPLHLILERMDNEELVQMLLLYGADPGIKNGNKRNALGVAAENLRVMSAWFLLENDLLSSAPESIKKASELCSKADGPDKNSKPLFKNMLSDWQGKEGKQRRIQLAQDCVLRVQRTPDMKTVDQTQVALELLETAGVPIGQAFAHR
ncbi:ANK_REP_REGION domain-containing protein [Lunasporangiospora selenospora]|uniref:ANK_REP_REGION domain-containing protein n=1 Tax=Lunasporangiospora selenospora TaxID=979761 RepID=A0A9P6FVJ7_9FUNG|nr:ANK_REP_REGION domain-containing protein [Lunasporangiospora selenospora]